MTTSDVQPETAQTERTLAVGTAPVPPYHDDGEPDFTPRPRKRAHPLTYALGALVLVGLGVLGGIAVQKHEDQASTTAASTTSAGGRTFGTRRGTGTSSGGTGSAAGGGSGGATVGTVTLVDGNKVYVTDTTGNVAKVVTNTASQLSKTDPATINDVIPGETVIVRGTTAADGSVTATSLTASPAGSSGGFRRSPANGSAPTGG